MIARLRAGVAAHRAGVLALWRTGAGRTALVLAGLLVAVTIAGLVALRPREAPPPVAGSTEGAQRAEVVGVTTAGCRPELGPGCRRLQIRLSSGATSTAVFAGDALSPLVEPGATVRVVPSVPPGAADPRPRGAVTDPWVFLDYDRRAPLLWLALAFALVIGVLARRRGLLALLGLGASLLVLVRFVVPAILDGRSPVLVAVVGALAVLVLTLLLAHGGITTTTLAAALGAAAALGLTAVLASVAVEAAQLTGFVSEQAVLLRSASGGQLEPRGLLLAGIVIGALGVLDDVTVSQASTVAALRRAAPAASARRLYGEAITVGRDHLAATVNTLALAYAGAALPVLLVFSSTGTSLAEAANREIVAQELVALLVGSIGLAAAVPLTTAVAVALVRRLPDAALADAAHAGHAH